MMGLWVIEKLQIRNCMAVTEFYAYPIIFCLCYFVRGVFTSFQESLRHRIRYVPIYDLWVYVHDGRSGIKMNRQLHCAGNTELLMVVGSKLIDKAPNRGKGSIMISYYSLFQMSV